MIVCISEKVVKRISLSPPLCLRSIKPYIPLLPWVENRGKAAGFSLETRGNAASLPPDIPANAASLPPEFSGNVAGLLPEFLGNAASFPGECCRVA